MPPPSNPPPGGGYGGGYGVSNFDGGYPVTLEVAAAPTCARWRPLINWLLVIPLEVALYIYNIVAQVLVFIGWFAALFTTRLPQVSADWAAGSIRFNARIQLYLYGITDVYPSFGIPLGRQDPGDSAVRIQFGPPERLSRLKVFFRYFMIIPQMIVLFFVQIAFSFVVLVAWFAVLITGRWPQGLQRFAIGYIRWTTRVNGFYWMLTDQYPPFSLD